MTQHNKNYRGECETPYLSWRWKVGQVWACDCGNLFKVGLRSYINTWKVWEEVK